MEWISTPYPKGRLGFIGTHHDVSVYSAVDGSIFAHGVFTRTDGWKIAFADHFEFETGGTRVRKRTTYLEEKDIRPFEGELIFSRESDCAVVNECLTATLHTSAGIVSWRHFVRGTNNFFCIDVGWLRAQGKISRFFQHGFSQLRPAGA